MNKPHISVGDISFVKSDMPGFWDIEILDRKISTTENIVYNKVTEIRQEALRTLGERLLSELPR